MIRLRFGMNRYQLAKEREKSRQLMDAFAIMADSVAMIAKVEVETPGDYGIGDLHEVMDARLIDVRNRCSRAGLEVKTIAIFSLLE